MASSIDSVPQGALTGSNNAYFNNFTATSSSQGFQLPFLSKQVTIINDGGNPLNFAFFGNPAVPPSVSYPYSDPQWTMVGTWTDATYNGTPAESTGSANTSYSASFLPNVAGVTEITFNAISGTEAAIAGISLSTNNGTTWVQPSTIAGLTRSDGATGTALNTYDEYANVSSETTSVTYTLPDISGAIWGMKISPTNTSNPSASSPLAIFIAGGSISISDANASGLLNSGESIGLDVATTSVSVASSLGTNGRLIVI